MVLITVKIELVVVKQRDDSVLFFGETLDSKLRKPGKMFRSKM